MQRARRGNGQSWGVRPRWPGAQRGTWERENPSNGGGAEGWAGRCVEPGYWRGGEGGVRRGALPFPPSALLPRPRRRKEHLAGFLTAVAGRSPPPPPRGSDCALSARPPRSAQARAWVGRGARRRRYGTRRAGPIRRFISGWRGRHFVRAAIKARWGPARPFSCCREAAA